MMEEMFKVYRYEKTFWGDRWCGPDTFTYGQETLIAHFPKDPEDGDGQATDVYCVAMPARFYHVKGQGFQLSTGSGDEMGDLAQRIAKAISQGMMTVEVG